MDAATNMTSNRAVNFGDEVEDPRDVDHPDEARANRRSHCASDGQFAARRCCVRERVHG